MLDYLKTKAEPTLLNIVLSNLVDNAIKFTPKGGKVTMSLIKRTFTIKDTGIGIEQDKLSMIFDEFYRINQLGKEHIKGYGLGLSMVKKIVDIHKAKMEIVSEVNLGTTISIEFKTLF
jgi:signal transduction histidine kinase